MPLQLQSKARTLESLLAARVPEFEVLPIAIVSYESYVATPEAVAQQMGTLGKTVIVRSSFSGEDGVERSHAGEYLSIAGIRTDAAPAVLDAMKRVFDSYPRQSNEILCVQPYLERVRISGVAFTHDLETQGPYYVINFDSSGSTNGVTSGAGMALNSYYHYRGSTFPPPDQDIRMVLAALRKLEELFNSERLDVEFAITNDNKLYILQVRPLTFATQNLADALGDADTVFDAGIAAVQELSLKNPFLLGQRTILGMMPDWNPAEIIGVRPRPLSMTLYKEVVTDNIWAYQRDRYGYRNLRSFPLMIDLYGFPFIDTRVCFNSFIPATLDRDIAEKLVNFYLDKLEKNPEFHDKVEFKIVYSCYDFDLATRIAELGSNGFSPVEIEQIKDSLKSLTEKIVSPATGLYKEDLSKTKILELRRAEILSSQLPALAKVYWLIEDCKRYGTLPFAGVARAAFIAVCFLNSLVRRGVMTEEEKMNFLGSLSTVGRSLTEDFQTLPLSDFLRTYGHLRPGTYDIQSARYDQTPDVYFGKFDQFPQETKAPHDFRLSLSQLDAIDRVIAEEKLSITSLELMRFIKHSIEGREFLKFAFTRNLSDALFLLEKWGRDNSFTVEQLSFLEWKSVMALVSERRPEQVVRSRLLSEIERNRDYHAQVSKIRLPALIVRPSDVISFKALHDDPNFIARQSFEGAVIELTNPTQERDNRIVLIPSADPGYDWLFTKGIKGLVTMYGGVNSHMAIRCAELGIPAVIGVGESLYAKIRNSSVVEFNPEQRTIKIVS